MEMEMSSRGISKFGSTIRWRFPQIRQNLGKARCEVEGQVEWAMPVNKGLRG